MFEVKDEICPCGSSVSFSDCCGRFLDGGRKALTAEELMRSRYSAYVTRNASYLVQTHSPKTRDAGMEKSIREWMAVVSWLGLNVVSRKKGGPTDLEGEVEFIAEYSVNGRIEQQHEKSLFKKIRGDWYYVDETLD